VTDHPDEDAKAAARCLEEFGELLHLVSPVDCVSSRGDEMRIGKKCCTGHGRIVSGRPEGG